MNIVVISSLMVVSLWSQGIYAGSSCLSLLGGTKCAIIQTEGQHLADQVVEMDNIIQEVLFRAIADIRSMIKPSMEFLQKEASKYKISNPPKTPIETNALTIVENAILKTAIKSIRDANEKFWILLKKITLVSFNDQTVADYLFAHKKRTMHKRSATMNSLNGIINSVAWELKVILVSVDTNVKKEATKGFQLFSDSLKQLLQGKTGIDFDGTKNEMERLLSNSMSVTVDSILDHGKVVLTEATRSLEKINGMVKNFKGNTPQFNQVLLPARELILEHMQKIFSSADDVEMQNKLQSLITMMKETYLQTKKTVSH